MKKSNFIDNFKVKRLNDFIDITDQPAHHMDENTWKKLFGFLMQF